MAVNNANKEPPEELKKILAKVYDNKVLVKDVIEGAYDQNWLQEYTQFYSSALGATPYVRRLILKDTKNNLKGFVHVRSAPDAPKLSETYIMSPFENTEARKFYVTCEQTFNDYGFKIRCVPFIMPDTVFSMCAQASLWICLRLLNAKHVGLEKFKDLPAIQKSASGSYYSDGEGLMLKTMNRIFMMNGCSAFYYNSKDNKLTEDELINILYAYFESGFPVIIGVNVADLPWWPKGKIGYHSIVVIGHTMQNNKVDKIIVHDESVLPYQT